MAATNNNETDLGFEISSLDSHSLRLSLSQSLSSLKSHLRFCKSASQNLSVAISNLLLSVSESLSGGSRGELMESATQMTQSGLPPSTKEGLGGVTQGTETNAPQQPEVNPVVPAKKRKNVESRSKVWEHFEKIFDSENKVIKLKCLYCAKVYQCESKKHGTTSLRNHMFACLKNSHSKETRQSLLTFTAVTTFDTQGGSEGVVGELGTWVFNQEAIRRALCEMIIINDELPFRFVEGQGFKRFILVACPRFCILSRWTISRDIYQIYLDERLNLKKLFKLNTQRVSLTTDTWTFVQRINYMCITAHFIDDQWKLNKKIISFVPISSHKDEHIAKALDSCLIDWGIRDVFSVTVDNASSNDTAMDSSVKKVRDSVRWMRNSPARLKKFRDLAELLGVEAKSFLQLDVLTRWNNTYMMLSTAIQYKVVFDAYSLNEPSFAADLGFYEITIRIYGSLYVTSNSFFSEISDLSCMLSSMIVAGSATEFEELYGKDNGKTCLENVQAAMVELFGDYAATYSVNVQQSSSDSSSGSQPDVPLVQSHTTIGRPQNMLKNKLKRWWKLNSERFPTLSKMTRDILAVPISTVASESTFSTSGRVLDAFRSSLTPKIVEALVCAQDWMRLSNQPVKVEENIDDVEKIEQGLATGISRFGITGSGVAVFTDLAMMMLPPLSEMVLGWKIMKDEG
ncbi:PREDICTED: zinc finger BED domain-containing protein RICESLEEPER 3-like [Ipomoea nil]|uniref:zinc finger BED domain-containing protein RICESLEEPER 3-like n=1 Tax=Ipomoea nil TaxID=35883 RepID=UPI0009013AD8|nr:PREDICTED: zinc finger BED domain-containing protein RICESLEEPER 3-like [Ipomoea nil]